jgi:radical SAM superfamily enzyme YgiQ (UPF0313 family)
MKPRVLFVSPAKLYPIDKEGRTLQRRRINVSVPALTILGALKHHKNPFDVYFMDLAADGFNIKTKINEKVASFGLPDEAVLKKISEIDPVTVLITSMFSSEQSTVDSLVSTLKDSFPRLPVIVGGVHATVMPAWLRESGKIDFIVSGEGEETITGLMDCIVHQGIDQAKRRYGQITHTETIIDLDRPWAFDEVLFREDGTYRYSDIFSTRGEMYTTNDPKGTRSFSLFYSRGCPKNCGYCTTTARSGREIRHAGHERMFRDVRFLYERYGVSLFYNQADTFGSSREDIEFLRLVAEYREKHPEIVLNNPNAFSLNLFFSRSGNYELDEKFLDLLAAAGFNVISLAVESFQRKFNRKIMGEISSRLVDKIKRLLAGIRSRGMKSEIYMMYGFLEQNEEEFDEDIQSAEELKGLADKITWHRCTVLPGSRYFQLGLEKGLITEKLYRKTAIEEGFFCDGKVEQLNLSRIPSYVLEEFRKRRFI